MAKGKLKKGCRYLKGGKMVCKAKSPKGAKAAVRARHANSSGVEKVQVSRDEAKTAGGKLKKGCRWVKGGGAICAKKLTVSNAMPSRLGDNLRGLGRLVSRKSAMRGGRLRKGCRFLKNGGAVCKKR